MYKNISKFKTSRIAAAISLIIGIPLCLISTLGVLAILGLGDTAEYIVLPILVDICAVIMIISGISTLRIMGAASYTAWTLEKDTDGVVSMDIILSRKGKKKGSSYERLILKALAKGYLMKVAYDSNSRNFELTDRVTDKEDYDKRFVGINCPNCGAPLKIREGGSLVCPTCGSEVKT